MEFSPDALFNAQTLMLILTLLIGGVICGLLAGMLGIGGGGILVPILFELFGFIGVDESVRTHLAIGTSLAVIIPTSIRSFLSHRAKGAVDEEVIKSMWLYVILGVLGGTLIASWINGEGLRLVYAVLILLLGMKMLFAPKSWRLGDHIPAAPFSQIYGSCVGLASTLMGIGGGTFISMMMTMYNRTIHQAVATSSGFGPVIGVPAALGYIWAGWGAEGLPLGSLGYVSVLGAVLIAPTSVLFAPLGVKISHSLSRRHLEIAFGVFLLVVAIRFLISLS